ncbi:hypothetical protein ACO0SA_002934 [Hanseniaspora valbyensis]
MAKLIQNFCHKVTKSLDSNELKYMNDSKFDILIEHLKPDNKLLLPISDGKIENEITDDGIDAYYMQDDLDVSNDNHDDHTDSNESVIESYFENQEEQNEKINNDVYFFNGGIDDHKGSKKKSDTKSLKSMANSKFTSNTAPSSHFSKHLRPFKIDKNGRKSPVFDPERTQRLYASADLTLNRLESILLRSFLIRLSDKLYSKEPIFGILNSEKSFENTNDRIKDNYHVFLKYDYLKNVMEWEDNEASCIKNRESRYSTDFYKQVPLAFSHFTNEENNTNSFKNYCSSATLVPLPYRSGDYTKQKTKEENLSISSPRATSPSDDIEVHADDEISTNSIVHLYPKNVSIPKDPLSSLPFKFFGSYAERGNNTIENILLGDILEEKDSSQEDIAQDPENNFISLYDDDDDNNNKLGNQ